VRYQWPINFDFFFARQKLNNGAKKNSPKGKKGGRSTSSIISCLIYSKKSSLSRGEGGEKKERELKNKTKEKRVGNRRAGSFYHTQTKDAWTD